MKDETVKDLLKEVRDFADSFINENGEDVGLENPCATLHEICDRFEAAHNREIKVCTEEISRRGEEINRLRDCLCDHFRTLKKRSCKMSRLDTRTASANPGIFSPGDKRARLVLRLTRRDDLWYHISDVENARD